MGNLGEIMCFKRRGGLGVRSLRKFNVAMLAKQGWGVLIRANPFVLDIMQARNVTSPM